MSKFRTVFVFVTANLKSTFHAQFVGTFMIDVHTKFHMPSSNSSVFIAVKQKVKGEFCITAIAMFSLLKTYLNESCIFLKIYYDTSSQSHKLRLTSTTNFLFIHFNITSLLFQIKYPLFKRFSSDCIVCPATETSYIPLFKQSYDICKSLNSSL
jgi:hypothetical protein